MLKSAILLGALSGSLFAQTVEEQWLERGVLGLLLTAIVFTRAIVPGWTHKDVIVERDELKAENRKMIDLMLAQQKDWLPALTASNHAVSEAMTELRLLRERRGNR